MVFKVASRIFPENGHVFFCKWPFEVSIFLGYHTQLCWDWWSTDVHPFDIRGLRSFATLMEAIEASNNGPFLAPRSRIFFWDQTNKMMIGLYPLVNIQKAMEHHHAFFMGKLTISMAIFNSYVDITRGYLLVIWQFATEAMDRPLDDGLTYYLNGDFP